MINPQPVAGPRSPYSNHTNRPTQPQYNQNSPHNPLNQTPLDPKKSRGKKIRKVVFAVFAAVFIAGGVFATKSYLALQDDILVGDGSAQKAAILDYEPGEENNFDPSKFTQLGQGRFNMLFLGVDKAAGLSDSIQVLSVDTINKKATLTSLPRDFYVYSPPQGERTKINEVYRDAERKEAGSGGAVIKEVVGDIFGTPITNFAVIDFQGLEDLVDALGGIEVTVEKDLYDPTFPAETGITYSPFSIKAGTQTLDGRTALRYARCRNGNCGNDFGRSERQQQVIDAIRKKAFSVGVLTNPVKVTTILAALGKSFKTDLELDHIRTLLSIYSSIPDGETKGYVLDTSAELGLLTSQSSPGYISFPKLGFDKFDDIHRWYRKNNPDPLLAKETPMVSIAAATGTTTKQLEAFQAYLADFGYTVVISETAVPTKYKTTKTTIYEVSSGRKPFARNYLGTQFNVGVEKGSPLNSTSDFEIIYAPASSTSASLSKKPSASPASSASPLD